ncbi:MAG TPA: hypothetical protein VFW45_14830 [Candidatus Polarisedimenticolia bacterium]|nr:hypothetical protein [Candidatus Polarisedimenticolia bacterium]
MEDPVCRCGHPASSHVMEPPEVEVDPKIDAPEEAPEPGRRCTAAGCSCPDFTPA